MKIKIQTIVFFLILFVFCFLKSSLAQEDDLKNKFIEKYVRAINDKNKSEWEELMYPHCRRCINDLNQLYFEGLFQSINGTIPSNYETTISPLSNADKKEIDDDKRVGLNWPAYPAYRLEIKYIIHVQPDQSKDIVTYWVCEGNKYYLVYGCPTVGWMVDYRNRLWGKIRPDHLSNWKYPSGCGMKPLSNGRCFIGDCVNGQWQQVC